MKQVRRSYVVNDQGHVQRIAQPYYQRLMAGGAEMAPFADRAIRFAEMTLWLDADRMIVRALTWFPLVHFDRNGRRDLAKREEETALTIREMATPPESEWSELYRAERFAAFRWTPTQDTLDRLRACLPHHPMQVPTEIPGTNLSS